MLSGDLAAVAAAVLERGADGLGRFQLQLFRPVRPMLAQPADDVEDALERLSRAGLEYKLDGARVQLHKQGEEIRVYSRQLREVSGAVPELVEAARSWPARELIVDGETLALRADGRPHSFQTTMRRFGRKLDVAALRAELPLAGSWFDCLLLDGEPLIDRPAQERIEALGAAVPEAQRVARIVTADAEQADAFFRAALDAGHEGVMAKALESPYEAGGRGGSWLKLKPAHTLDLVVLAAEWGSGRRRGWLSNLHLGARDGTGFAMLGKTFKGLTDELLRWQTARLLELELARDAQTVYVRPELVVEVAFNDVQSSPHYPAGLALRFARVKGYRPDKRPEEADSLEAVRAIHAASQ
jgi:DNA ligase-1